ncbi:hypothetical protein BD626DRAFT_491145 [Schizophyllum amplum]|uniref:Uncharacterized protein n=1 Tax=Schizophyllum amplum TaxID=97359 RepID=A0A550CHH5_9AGAR|nr:hypothetical protein BD626DRAFT_491145 [Auriculariopsis ampla]
MNMNTPSPSVPQRQYGWTSSSSWSQHTLRQLRFILPGGAAAYYLDLAQELQRVLLQGAAGWGRTTALAGVGLGLLTVVMFLYVLIAPWMTGSEMDYASWQQDGTLSTVIPMLTVSIAFGWSTLAATFCLWSDLGYTKGVIGATAAYMLIFGLLGLLPSMKANRFRHD